MSYRKSVLVGAVASLALTALAAASLPTAPVLAAADASEATDTATGVVFHDVNGNSVRDEGEQGVADVRVSNGREVVATDADGRYELPVDDETILFITKPSAYMVPVDDQQLPQFYYLHYPDGSPHDLEFGGIEPTGPLPESVDFPVVAQPDPDEFAPLVFADPQTADSAEIDDMERDVIDELVGTDAPFGLTVGDIVNDPLDLFGEHNEAVARIGIPWWNLPGNHDMNFDAPDDTHATDTYKRIYGPTNYSFDYGRVHFVALDNVEHLGPGKSYRGVLSDEQLQWLENDLAFVPDDKLVVIATHIPLRTDATDSEKVNTANLPGLFEVLEGREHVYSIAGHDTSNSWQMYLGADDGWTGAEPFHHQVLAEVRGGGWRTGPVDERGIPAADMADGNPNGYYRIGFDGTDYAPRYKPASLDESFQIRLSFDGGEGDRSRVPAGPSGSDGFASPVRYHPRDWDGDRRPTPQVQANVFDGGERHRVEVSIDGGGYTAMEHSPPADDPYMTALFAEFEGTPEQPARPQPSSHLWTADLPEDLRPGQHALTVRSTDPYGQVSESSAPFEIVTGRPDGE